MSTLEHSVAAVIRRAAALHLAILVGCFGGIGSAAAHHSFPVHFVPDELVTISGVVTEFSFRNPHGLVFLTVQDGSGEQQWKVETNSPNILRRRGWSPSSLQPGDRVTIEGYPARDGSNFMRVYRLTFADGRELIGQRPEAGVASGED